MSLDTGVQVATPFDVIKKIIAETLVQEFTKNPLAILTATGNVKSGIISNIRARISEHYPCRSFVIDGMRVSVSLEINCCIQTFSYSICDMQDAMDLRAYLKTGSWVRTVSVKNNLVGDRG